MKKVYAKPQIMFEDFSLSTSIATGCKLITNAVEGVCGYLDEELGGKIIFNADWSGCVYKNEDNICYDVPTLGYELFSS